MPRNSELFSEFYEGFKTLQNILESQKREVFSGLTVGHRKTLAEAAIFLNEMLHQIGLNEEELSFAKTWIRQIGHVLGREFEGNSILRIHYFEKNYQDSPGTTVQSMISLMVALRALETCGFKLMRGGTVWNYLERDIPCFRKELSKILLNDISGEKVNELFLLLNTIDTLACIGDSEVLERELKEFIRLTGTLQSSFGNAFGISPGLKIYAADLVDRMQIPIHIGDLPKELRGKPAAFMALMKLRKRELPSMDLINRAHHTSSLHLWWIAKAWRRRLTGEDFVGILPFYQSLNVDSAFRIVWGDLYSVSITKGDIELVLRLTSQEIKQQLYQYFLDHPKVTDFGKSRLSTERDKADAGGEISDFNVEFDFGGEKIWVTIPIKSGRECRNQSRKRIEQSFIYQFIRPLVTFETEKVIVFPIILVRPTLNTTEFLSLIRARLRLPIMVLDIETYTRFLKRENFLSSG